MTGSQTKGNNNGRKVKRPLTPEQIHKAKEAAEKKAQAIIEQIKKDQTWLDENTKDMSQDNMDELFRQASAKCRGTTKTNGRIVTACPLPKKLEYCVKADPFTCPSGKAESAAGCTLSDEVSKSLRDETTCIDGSFVSNAEGGSYMSPYVPWGPISGATKDGAPVLTTGNSSGVTIGTGVDLGAVSDSEKYLARLEKAGVSKETRDRLKPFLGKKKAEACKALREAKQNGTLVLPQKDVELIDLDAMQTRVPTLKSQYERAKANRIKSFNNQIKKERRKRPPNQSKIDDWQKQIDSTRDFSDLSCTEQTILFSTLYHEGSIGKPHSKPLVDAMLTGDDDAVRAALVAKTTHGNKLIASRGKRELSYYDEGN